MLFHLEKTTKTAMDKASGDQLLATSCFFYLCFSAVSLYCQGVQQIYQGQRWQ